MKLYNIFYIDDTYGEPPCYQCTTDNPKKWLKEHNKQRIEDGNDAERLEYFDVQEVDVLEYNNGGIINE